MPEIQDKILFEKIRNARDHQAFDILFRRWYAPLWSYACHFVDSQDAENVVQDVMVYLWEKASCINLRESLSKYLYTAVKNKCLTLISRGVVKGKALTAIRSSIIDASLDTDPAVEKELSIRLQSELCKLPEAQRIAFELSRIEKLSFAQIAEQTGVSGKTVEYRVYQAIKKLRIALVDVLPLLGVLLAIPE